MKSIRNKGFTLIELLVVIAIIGILSSVVLASLTSARNKGADAAIKAQLANIGPSAEIFYDTPSSYLGFCATTNPIWVQAAGVITKSAGPGSPVCGNDATTWAVYSTLKNPTTGTTGWCADNSGFIGASNGLSSGGTTELISPSHCL
jgi:prepilin-type N-terminal cleavage/methylation domain-containing protein